MKPHPDIVGVSAAGSWDRRSPAMNTAGTLGKVAGAVSLLRLMALCSAGRQAGLIAWPARPPADATVSRHSLAGRWLAARNGIRNREESSLWR
jgi:hypothetical protein